tara:strand:- start:990 stop:1190 length:201 start_codon:yes stop_codon:yes gene_type:complete
MNKDELEEYRYDVANALLNKMSKGSQYMHALDRMLHLLKDHTEQELREIAAPKEKKPKDKKKFGFK